MYMHSEHKQSDEKLYSGKYEKVCKTEHGFSAHL